MFFCNYFNSKRLFVKLIFFCFFVSACGISNQHTLKITEGYLLDKADKLFDVMVKIGYWCSGTLIAPNWVLTAGHCVKGLNVSDLEISHRGRGIESKRVIVHPDYSPTNIAKRNDIALVELKSHITLKSGPMKLMIAYRGNSTGVRIAGFGKSGSYKYLLLKSLIDKTSIDIAKKVDNMSEEARNFLADYAARVNVEKEKLLELQTIVGSFSYDNSLKYPKDEIEMAAFLYRESRTNRHFSEFDIHFKDQMSSNEKLRDLKKRFYATDPQGIYDGKARMAHVRVLKQFGQYLAFMAKDGVSGSCQGDSGGPMVIDSGGGMYQIGVGHGYNLEDYRSAIDICGGTGLYTRIDDFLGFIEKYLQPQIHVQG